MESVAALQALPHWRCTAARMAACAALAALGVAMTPARAQTPGAGQLERQFGSPPALPRSDGPTVPQTPGQQAPADADKVRFTLKQVELAGNTVLPAAVPASVWAPLVGREISLGDLFRLADELTLRYRNEGYVLTRVVVPPQNIRDGTVQLQVVEGFIAQTRV